MDRRGRGRGRGQRGRAGGEGRDGGEDGEEKGAIKEDSNALEAELAERLVGLVGAAESAAVAEFVAGGEACGREARAAAVCCLVARKLGLLSPGFPADSSAGPPLLPGLLLLGSALLRRGGPLCFASSSLAERLLVALLRVTRNSAKMLQSGGGMMTTMGRAGGKKVIEGEVKRGLVRRDEGGGKAIEHDTDDGDEKRREGIVDGKNKKDSTVVNESLREEGEDAGEVLVAALAAFRTVAQGNAVRVTKELLAEAVLLLESTAQWALLAIDAHPLAPAEALRRHAAYRQCLACLGALAVGSSAKFPTLFPGIVSFLCLQLQCCRSRGSSQPRSPFAHALLSCLRVLSPALLQSPSPPDLLASLLRDLNALVSFGLSSSSSSSNPHSSSRSETYSLHSSSNDDEANWLKTGSFSDSESENEGCGGGVESESGPPRGWKIRVAALRCLTAVAKSNQKYLFGCWETLLGEAAPSEGRDLFDAVDKDPSLSVRVAAVTLLNAVMERSAPLLVAATDLARPPPSFEPFSYRLAQLLRRLHSRALAALGSQRAVALQVALLKLLATLLANTPYRNLRGDLLGTLLEPLFARICPFLDTPPQVAHAAACCLSAAVSTAAPLPALADSLRARLPSVLAILPAARPVVAAELCGFLGAAARLYLPVLTSHWPRLAELAGVFVASPDEDARAAALRMLEQICKACASASLHFPDLWQHLLQPLRLHALFSDPNPSLRALSCAVFASFPAVPFADCSQRDLIAFITSLFCLLRDPSPLVRASAARCLGSLVRARGFPSLCLTDSVCLLIELLQDPLVSVRLKASWALANICELLSEEEKEAETTPSAGSSNVSTSHVSSSNVSPSSSESDPPYDLPSDVLLQIADSLIASVADQDKVRCNAVRAIGHYSRLSTLSELPDELLACVIAQLLECLSKGSVKVRWNACYALGQACHNPRLHPLLSSASALPSLANTVLRSSNFKVRLQGLSALASAPHSLLKPSADALLPSLRPLGDSLAEQQPSGPLATRYHAEVTAKLEQVLLRLVE